MLRASLWTRDSSSPSEHWLSDNEVLDDNEVYPTDERDLQNLTDFDLPSNIGKRPCIGRNLAHLELSTVICCNGVEV